MDGGAVAFNDGALTDKAMLVRDCGIDRDIFRDELGEIDPKCDISLTGHSATMSNVNAYIGICQMDSMDDILSRQRSNAKHWARMIEKINDETEKGQLLRTLGRDEISPNYWVYGILASDKKESIRMFRDKGFYASGVHIVLNPGRL